MRHRTDTPIRPTCAEEVKPELRAEIAQRWELGMGKQTIARRLGVSYRAIEVVLGLPVTGRNVVELRAAAAQRSGLLTGLRAAS